MCDNGVQKNREFALNFWGRGPPLFVVAREFEVDRRRKGTGIRRHCCEKMRRLRLAGYAERKEMIGAPNNSGGVTVRPIFGERRVREIRAFSCLDIRKLNSDRLYPVPINLALVVGNIDAADGILGSRGRVRDPDPKKAQRETHDRDSAKAAGDLQKPAKHVTTVVFLAQKSEGRLRFRKRPSFRWR